MASFDCGSGVTGNIDFRNARLSGDHPNVMVHYDVYGYWTSRYGHSQSWSNASGFAHYTSRGFNVVYGNTTLSPEYSIGTVSLRMDDNRQLTSQLGVGLNAYYSGQTLTYVVSPLIPQGSFSCGLLSVNHNSATFNISQLRHHNYWFTEFRDRTNGADTWLANCQYNGTVTLPNLVSGRTYSIFVNMKGMDGSSVQSQYFSFMTTGASFIAEPVHHILGNQFYCLLKSYSDSFYTNLVCVMNNEIVAYWNGVHTSGTVKGLTYNLEERHINYLYSLMPNSQSLVGAVINATTYAPNGAVIGGTSYPVVFYANPAYCSPYFDTIDYKIDDLTYENTGDPYVVIDKVTKLAISIKNASTRYYSTISQIQYFCGGHVLTTTASIAGMAYPLVGNTGIDVVITDSRSFQYRLHKNFLGFVEYEKPVISKLSTKRENDVEEETILSLDGNWTIIESSGGIKNDKVVMKYAYKPTSSTSWSDVFTKQVTYKDNTFSYNNIVAKLDGGQAYDFEVSVSDNFYTATARSIVIKSTYELFIGDGYVNCGEQLKIQDKNIIDLIVPIGTIIWNDKKEFNPNIVYPGTSWNRALHGRVPVGVSEGDPDFSYSGQTSGAKFHSLHVLEMPSHNHNVMTAIPHSDGNIITGEYINAPLTYGQARLRYQNHQTNQGINQGHPNLQPATALYCWYRSA